jgi:hypothetical protein
MLLECVRDATEGAQGSSNEVIAVGARKPGQWSPTWVTLDQ